MADRSTKRSRPLSLAGLAVLSGFLLVLVFPKFNLSPLSLVALAPLLIAAIREPAAGRRFLWGYLGGCVFFAGTCYWIYLVMRQHGSLGVAEAAGVFGLLFLALAVYWGLFAWIAGYLWAARWGPLAVAPLWVSLEFARAHLLSGFPWLLFGYALTDHFTLARVARWTGVYGTSFLLVSVNVALVWFFTRRSRAASIHLGVIAGILLLLGLTATPETYLEDQKAYLVQTNIPQEAGLEIWDLPTQAPLLDRLQALTTEAVGRQDPPALVVWPEVPASFYFGEDSFTQEYAEGIARQTNSYFLMGIVALVRDPDVTKPLNSAILLNPGGGVISRYDKIHLVPFGEYVPLRGLLGFAGKLTDEIGDFIPGKRFVVSPLPGGQVGTFICYEAIFPDLVRRFVKDGAGGLVTISNDGWFGTSAARHQHLLMARMRAIENARYLLRATNTGITALIRPDGGISAELPPDEPGVLAMRWAFQNRQTFYSRHGDWFAVAACMAALLACLAVWSAGRRKKI